MFNSQDLQDDVDQAIADMFDIDLQMAPADDLLGLASSEDCTNNGCTASCQTC